jgi:hypothetical protein
VSHAGGNGKSKHDVQDQVQKMGKRQSEALGSGNPSNHGLLGGPIGHDV